MKEMKRRRALRKEKKSGDHVFCFSSSSVKNKKNQHKIKIIVRFCFLSFRFVVFFSFSRLLFSFLRLLLSFSRLFFSQGSSTALARVVHGQHEPRKLLARLRRRLVHCAEREHGTGRRRRRRRRRGPMLLPLVVLGEERRGELAERRERRRKKVPGRSRRREDPPFEKKEIERLHMHRLSLVDGDHAASAPASASAASAVPPSSSSRRQRNRLGRGIERPRSSVRHEAAASDVVAVPPRAALPRDDLELGVERSRAPRAAGEQSRRDRRRRAQDVAPDQPGEPGVRDGGGEGVCRCRRVGERDGRLGASVCVWGGGDLREAEREKNGGFFFSRRHTLRLGHDTRSFLFLSFLFFTLTLSPLTISQSRSRGMEIPWGALLRSWTMRTSLRGRDRAESATP